MAHIDVAKKIVNLSLRDLTMLMDGQTVEIRNIFGDTDLHLTCIEKW